MENGKPSREWDKGSKASSGENQQRASDLRIARKHLDAHHKETEIEIKRMPMKDTR